MIGCGMLSAGDFYESGCGKRPAEGREFREQVGEMFDDLVRWSAASGWKVERDQATIDEFDVGTYVVPTMIIRVDERTEVAVKPYGAQARRGRGRVDLYGRPAFTHVMLLGGPGQDGWTVMTDSNIPLRQTWNAQSFQQLVKDLTA